MIVLERKSKAECVWLLRQIRLLTLRKARVCSQPCRASLSQQLQPLQQPRITSGERQRGYHDPGHPIPDVLDGRREGQGEQPVEGVCCCQQHPARCHQPHLALAQGAALQTDTASSWAMLPAGH